MEEQVGALLTAVLERNELHPDDLISIWFTATPDLHSDFPAAAPASSASSTCPSSARRNSTSRAPCPASSASSRTSSPTGPRSDIAHVYLGAAAALRKDIAQ